MNSSSNFEKLLKWVVLLLVLKSTYSQFSSRNGGFPGRSWPASSVGNGLAWGSTAFRSRANFQPFGRQRTRSSFRRPPTSGFRAIESSGSMRSVPTGSLPLRMRGGRIAVNSRTTIERTQGLRNPQSGPFGSQRAPNPGPMFLGSRRTLTPTSSRLSPMRAPARTPNTQSGFSQRLSMPGSSQPRRFQHQVRTPTQLQHRQLGTLESSFNSRFTGPTGFRRTNIQQGISVERRNGPRVQQRKVKQPISVRTRVPLKTPSSSGFVRLPVPSSDKQASDKHDVAPIVTVLTKESALEKINLQDKIETPTLIDTPPTHLNNDITNIIPSNKKITNLSTSDILQPLVKPAELQPTTGVIDPTATALGPSASIPKIDIIADVAAQTPVSVKEIPVDVQTHALDIMSNAIDLSPLPSANEPSLQTVMKVSPSTSTVPHFPAISQDAVGSNSFNIDQFTGSLDPTVVQPIVAEPLTNIAVPIVENTASRPSFYEDLVNEFIAILDGKISSLNQAPASAVVQQPNPLSQIPMQPMMSGYPFAGYPWMYGPMNSAMMQEMMFGDTTDPPDPIQTTPVPTPPTVTTIDTSTQIPVVISTIPSTPQTESSVSLPIVEVNITAGDIVNLENMTLNEPVLHITIPETKMSTIPDTTIQPLASTTTDKPVTEAVTTAPTTPKHVDTKVTQRPIKVEVRQKVIKDASDVIIIPGEKPADGSVRMQKVAALLHHAKGKLSDLSKAISDIVVARGLAPEDVPSAAQLGISVASLNAAKHQGDRIVSNHKQKVVDLLGGKLAGLNPPSDNAAYAHLMTDAPYKPTTLAPEPILEQTRPTQQPKYFTKQPEVYQTLQTLLVHNPNSLSKVITTDPTAPSEADAKQLIVKSLIDADPSQPHLELKKVLRKISSPTVAPTTPAIGINVTEKLVMMTQATTLTVSDNKDTKLIMANVEGIPFKIEQIKPAIPTPDPLPADSGKPLADPTGTLSILSSLTGKLTQPMSQSKKDDIAKKLQDPKIQELIQIMLKQLLVQAKTKVSTVATIEADPTTTSAPFVTTTEEFELEDLPLSSTVGPDY